MTLVEDSVVEAAARVALVAREQSDDMSRRRELSVDVLQAMRDGGVTRMLMPEVLGGQPESLPKIVDVIATIAAADGSTGWCTAISAGVKHFAGYVPERVARQLWADPDDGCAGMFGPTGTAVSTGLPDRYLLTGRWPFTSNCLHATHIGLAAWFRPEADAPPEPAPRIVFVPTAATTVHHTWGGIGLRGTGSHDTSVSELEVDRTWSCSLTDRPWVDEPLWRLPLFTVLAPPLAAVLVGIARGALDDVTARASQGSRARGTLLDDPIGIADLASADAALRAAHAGLVAACERVWRQALNGTPVDRPTQAHTFMASHHAADIAVDVTATAHRLAGGRSAYINDRVARALSDVHAGRQHILFGHGIRSALGQIIAGGDVAIPPFIL